MSELDRNTTDTAETKAVLTEHLSPDTEVGEHITADAACTDDGQRDTGADAPPTEDCDTGADTPQIKLEAIPKRRVKYLRRVPFVRLFANLFDYRGNSTRGEFLLDFGLLTLASVLLLLLTMRIEPLLAILATPLFFFPPALSLLARRLNDAGHRWWLCFFSFIPICLIVIFILCLSRTRGYKVKYPIVAKALAIILLIILLIVLINPYSLLLGGFMADVLVTGNGITTDLTKDVDDYYTELAEVGNAEQLMPRLDGLGDHEELHFASKETLYSFMLSFYSTGISLYVEYGENYDEMKEKALTEHAFLESSVQDSDGDIELPGIEFSHRGFTYRVVADPDYIDFCACKSFMLVGYNDEVGMIAYHYFYDFDLDYIVAKGEDPAEQMRELMDKSFHKFNFK